MNYQRFGYLPKPQIFVVLLEYKVGKLFYFKVNGKSSAVKCLMETAVNYFLFPKFTEFYHFKCIKCIASSFNDVVTRLVCISPLISLWSAWMSEAWDGSVLYNIHSYVKLSLRDFSVLVLGRSLYQGGSRKLRSTGAQFLRILLASFMIYFFVTLSDCTKDKLLSSPKCPTNLLCQGRKELSGLLSWSMFLICSLFCLEAGCLIF